MATVVNSPQDTQHGPVKPVPKASGDAQRSPQLTEAEQLRRDRVTALVTLAVVVVLFAVMVTLAAVFGEPVAPDSMPWIMP